jgi:hypothetical protein
LDNKKGVSLTQDNPFIFLLLKTTKFDIILLAKKKDSHKKFGRFGGSQRHDIPITNVIVLFSVRL